MVTKVYIAAPWVKKPMAAQAKEMFERAGFTVTSNWITEHPEAKLGLECDRAELTRQALADLDDLEQADAFVILNLDKSEGKATELGAAYYWRKPIILVGERTVNLFYHLPSVVQVDTVQEAIGVCLDL